MVIKSFQESAESKGFDGISEYKDSKYTTIKNYDLDVYHNHSELSFVDDPEHPELDYSHLEVENPVYRNEDDEVDITVCYTLWQNPIYVKLLYLSFLSQILYTDVLNVKKFQIITDKKLEPLVWKLFLPFTQNNSGNFEVDIKTVNSEHLIYSSVASNTLTPERINKYIISLFEETRETDLLILSDCESFTYGKKSPIYSKIYRQYSNENNFPILGCHESTPGRSVFLERRESLAGMMYDNDEYINWCSKRLEVSREKFVDKVIDRDDWFLTCWFVFDNEKYQSDHWKEYVEWSRVYSMYCDETIYLTYGWCKEDYNFEDLGYLNPIRFIDSRESESFFRKDEYKQTGIVHPLHGKYDSDMWVQDLYDAIQHEFAIELKQAHDKGVTLRELLPQYSTD